MATPVTNFADVEVDGLYTAGDLSIDVESGGGSRFPSTYPYPLTWWNSTDYARAAQDPNREIVSVTNRSADTFTIIRAQEGTSASAKNTSGKTYRVSLGITAAMLNELSSSGTPSFSGLCLQTSLDADRAKHRVELTAVEFIVMDDGTILRNDSDEWTGAAADITVSGAGGRDTGSEQASAWYEVYAIAKEDGTRNLLLHRAPWHSADAFHVSGEDATQGIRSDVDNSTVKVSQGFQNAESSMVTMIDAKLVRVGSPTGYIWFTIEADNAGAPSGTPLVTSAKIDVARIPTTVLNLTIPCYHSAPLSASTPYHLVAQGDWTVSASDYIGWRMDGSAGTYANGAKSLYDSDTGTWTADADDDMYFIIYNERNRSSVTMPSGYTKKRHIGYARNNHLSNFAPFIQTNRTWRHRDISVSQHVDVGDIAFSGPNKFAMSGSSVPFPMRNQLVLKVGAKGTGAAAATVAAGDYTATDLDSSTGVGAQIVLRAELTSAVAHVFGELSVVHGIIYLEGTASGGLKVLAFEW